MRVKVTRKGFDTDLLIEGDEVSVDYNLTTLIITHAENTRKDAKSETIIIPWGEILEVRIVD